MLRLLLLLVVLALLARVATLVRGMVRGRHDRLATGEVNVDPASVILGGILQTELPADLLDTRLDLLHMVRGMVSLPHDPGTSNRISGGSVRGIGLRESIIHV